MTLRHQSAAVTLRRLSAAALCVLLASLAYPGHSRATPHRVATAEVSFSVTNTNGSALPCQADGTAHELQGRLVGPPASLRQDALDLVTVYVHDFATASWFWDFPARSHVRAMARRGHVSLVFDRLGYGASPRPYGGTVCLGAQADMLHQVVEQLRAGAYGGQRSSPSADRVVLAGHSVGAGITELSAASFGEVDGLALMSWSDAGPSAAAAQEAFIETSVCLAGGDPRADAPAYAFFGQTRADFRRLLFRSAPAWVQRRAARMRSADPCGDVQTLGPMVSVNNLLTRSLDLPVLLMFGDADVLNRGEAADLQSNAYAPGAPVTTRTFAGSASALTLEAAAGDARRLLDRWLTESFSR